MPNMPFTVQMYQQFCTPLLKKEKPTVKKKKKKNPRKDVK